MLEPRRHALEAITADPLDVLIVGGGIVGAGVARDAAMRGLRVGLVERRDLASGTSSRTSRLLHGGLRYLAQWHIRLVRQSSREKRILHGIAPHLAQPLAFVFPTYRRSRWPRWKLRLGVKAYDLLCLGRNLGASRALGVERTRDLLPGIAAEGLTGAVRYFDALTSDARLVIDTLRSAARHGAMVATYTALKQAKRDGGVWRCRLSDAVAETELQARAKVIVNATGPWGAQFPQSSIKLRPTKGVHLVIDRDRLPVPDAVVMPEGERILFAIPWGERVILGTTDTDLTGPAEDVRPERTDAEYILAVANRAFPDADLAEGDIRSAWAGVRPLVATRSGGPSGISRAHEVRPHPSGWIDVAGGKLTTFRQMAEEGVNAAERLLGRRPRRSPTDTEPLLEPGEAEGLSGVIPPAFSEGLVERFCRDEWALSLEDVMLRRAGWADYAADPIDIAQRVANCMAPLLGWSDARRAYELVSLRRHDPMPTLSLFARPTSPLPPGEG